MTHHFNSKVTSLICLAIILTLSVCSTAQKRAWQPRDSFDTKGIGSLSVSPDKQSLLYVVSDEDVNQNKRKSRLWLMPTQGGEARPLTDGKTGVSNPTWSPDGRKIAFFSSDADGSGLWVMNRDGSGLRKLTNFERSNVYLGDTGDDLAWSPDSRFIAYTAAGPRQYPNIPSPQDPPNGNDVLVTDRLLYKAWYYYSDLRRTHVWTISVAGGLPKQISSGDHDYHSISWSPDGKKIACVSNQTGRDDFNANNDICILSTEGKKMVQLTRTIGPEYRPHWSPDGTKIAYLGRLRDHRSKESDAELKKVYVIPDGGGTPVNINAPLDRWSSEPQWSEKGDAVYFTAQNSGAVGIYQAPANGGSVNPIFMEKGRVGSFSLGENGEIFFVYSDFTQPDEIFRVDARGKGKKKLTSYNADFVDRIEIMDLERFSYSSFDDQVIEGWIVRPFDFQKDQKYPMILSVHGGPHGQLGYRLSGLFQLYAANGYVVVFTNPRGSSGYGQAFSDACVGDLGGGDYKDLMAGVDYVLEKYQFIDSERMGVTGGSYGGYLTNWITTHTNRFKAAVPISSISNLISMWGTCANTLWFETDMGFMPMDNYERAWAVSPLKYIKNCKTPTLFINGAWDHCTHVNQAEEMYTALKKLGVDATLAIYPNEGHGVRNQPAHTFDYHKRALAWFDNYLKPQSLSGL